MIVFLIPIIRINVLVFIIYHFTNYIFLYLECIQFDWVSIDFNTLEIKTPPKNANTEELKEKSFTFIDKMNRLKLRRLVSKHFVENLIKLKDSKNSRSYYVIYV